MAVVGGGLGGCAAALAALRAGRSVVLTEPTDWIGGQLTQQAVPPDEHAWIEQFGANASYFELRRGIRDYYRRHYPLTAEAPGRLDLNPGRGGVSRLCHEPRVALSVLTRPARPVRLGREVDRPARARAGPRRDARATASGSVTVRDLGSGGERTLIAPYFLDATELGDVLPLAGVEFVTGFESQAETGEPHAPEHGAAGQSAVFHLLLRDGLPAR